MAVTISPYNHTAQRFGSGANAASDTYKVKLLTAATFDPTNTTLTEAGGTEVASGTGYTTGGATLTGVSVTIVSTNGAKFDANDAIWSASSGGIAADYAIIYNDTDADDPPVAFIDFDGTESASDGTDFVITWNTNGIVAWTVT
jgi:flagellar capping protein FliD